MPQTRRSSVSPKKSSSSTPKSSKRSSISGGGKKAMKHRGSSASPPTPSKKQDEDIGDSITVGGAFGFAPFENDSRNLSDAGEFNDNDKEFALLDTEVTGGARNNENQQEKDATAENSINTTTLDSVNKTNDDSIHDERHIKSPNDPISFGHGIERAQHAPHDTVQEIAASERATPATTGDAVARDIGSVDAVPDVVPSTITKDATTEKTSVQSALMTADYPVSQDIYGLQINSTAADDNIKADSLDPEELTSAQSVTSTVKNTGYYLVDFADAVSGQEDITDSRDVPTNITNRATSEQGGDSQDGPSIQVSGEQTSIDMTKKTIHEQNDEKVRDNASIIFNRIKQVSHPSTSGPRSKVGRLNNRASSAGVITFKTDSNGKVTLQSAPASVARDSPTTTETTIIAQNQADAMDASTATSGKTSASPIDIDPIDAEAPVTYHPNATTEVTEPDASKGPTTSKKGTRERSKRSASEVSQPRDPPAGGRVLRSRVPRPNAASPPPVPPPARSRTRTQTPAPAPAPHAAASQPPAPVPPARRGRKRKNPPTDAEAAVTAPSSTAGSPPVSSASPPNHSEESIAAGRARRSAATKARQVIQEVASNGRRSENSASSPVSENPSRKTSEQPQVSKLPPAKRRKTPQALPASASSAPRRSTRSVAQKPNTRASTVDSAKDHTPSPTTQILQEANASAGISVAVPPPNQSEDYDELLREADANLMSLAEDIGTGGFTSESNVSRTPSVEWVLPAQSTSHVAAHAIPGSAPPRRSLIVRLKLSRWPAMEERESLPLPEADDRLLHVAPASKEVGNDTLEAARALMQLAGSRPTLHSPPPVEVHPKDISDQDCPICGHTLAEIRHMRQLSGRYGPISDSDLYEKHVELCFEYHLGDGSSECDDEAAAAQGDDADDDTVVQTPGPGDDEAVEKIPLPTYIKGVDDILLTELVSPEESLKLLEDPKFTNAQKLAVEENLVFSLYAAQREYIELEKLASKRRAPWSSRQPEAKRRRGLAGTSSKPKAFVLDNPVVYEDKKECVLYDFAYNPKFDYRGRQDPQHEEESSKQSTRKTRTRAAQKAWEIPIVPGYEDSKGAKVQGPKEPKETKARRNGDDSTRAANTPVPTKEPKAAPAPARAPAATATSATAMPTMPAMVVPVKKRPGRPRKDGLPPGSRPATAPAPAAAPTAAPVPPPATATVHAKENLVKLKFGKKGRESLKGILSREPSPSSMGGASDGQVAAASGETPAVNVEKPKKRPGRPRKDGRVAPPPPAAAQMTSFRLIPPPSGQEGTSATAADSTRATSTSSSTAEGLRRRTVEEEFMAAQNRNLGKRVRKRTAFYADVDDTDAAPKRKRRYGSTASSNP